VGAVVRFSGMSALFAGRWEGSDCGRDIQMCRRYLVMDLQDAVIGALGKMIIP
jgi:hypothetical protein